jgi:hypothetical protein
MTTSSSMHASRQACNKPLETLWRSYREQVLVHGLDECAVRDMRRSFFAGAQSVWALIMTDHVMPDSVPTEQWGDIHNLWAIDTELTEFIRDVEAGRA